MMGKELSSYFFKTAMSCLLSLVAYLGGTYINETRANTVAVVELSSHIERLSEKLEPIPRLQKDVSTIGERLRRLEKRKGNQ